MTLSPFHIRITLIRDEPLFEGGILALSEMDEVLFKIPDLLNYRTELRLRDGKDCLSVQAHTVLDASPEIPGEIETHLMKISAVKRAMSKSQFLLDPISKSPSDWPTTGTIKRILVDKRREHGATLSI